MDKGEDKDRMIVTNKDPLLSLLGALAALGRVTIHNARGGHACNSSSSHSIIILPPGAQVTEDPTDYYGWEDFALTTPTSKLHYLASQLGEGRIQGIPSLEEMLASYSIDLTSLDGVDHQSLLTFPQSQVEPGLDSEFLMAFAQLLLDPRIVILGGNDNGGASRHSTPNQVYFNLLGDTSWVSRKDSLNGQEWWVLYNPEDGTKLRISLDSDKLYDSAREVMPDKPAVLRPAPVAPPGPRKAQTPELVDLKLTDACPFEKDCAFCYMASTRGGQEASLEFITATLAALAKLRVFEVAFGGGEPTLWPHFHEVVRLSHQLGVTPNATSRNYSFLHTDEAQRTMPLMGALAFSVNSNTDLDRLDKELSRPLDREVFDKVAIQAIPALLDEKTLDRLLAYAQSQYMRITLLGYKTSGRGEDYSPTLADRPDHWWIETWKKYPRVALSVDTVLAQQCQAELVATGVPEWQYHVREGSYSMYIDGVTARAAASSYAGQGTPLDRDGDLVEQISAAFKTYAAEPTLPRRTRKVKETSRGVS